MLEVGMGAELKLCTLGGGGASLILGEDGAGGVGGTQRHLAETEQRQKLERRGLLILRI